MLNIHDHIYIKNKLSWAVDKFGLYIVILIGIIISCVMNFLREGAKKPPEGGVYHIFLKISLSRVGFTNSGCTIFHDVILFVVPNLFGWQSP